MTSKVDLHLKSFDLLSIEKTHSKILQINHYLNHPLRLRVGWLPTLKKRFTVLRSPHIDKKSREHFEWKRYKKVIHISFSPENGARSLFLFLLKNSSFPGVQMEINVKHSTFFSERPAGSLARNSASPHTN